MPGCKGMVVDQLTCSTHMTSSVSALGTYCYGIQAGRASVHAVHAPCHCLLLVHHRTVAASHVLAGPTSVVRCVCILTCAIALKGHAWKAILYFCADTVLCPVLLPYPAVPQRGTQDEHLHRKSTVEEANMRTYQQQQQQQQTTTKTKKQKR